MQATKLICCIKNKFVLIDETIIDSKGGDGGTIRLIFTETEVFDFFTSVFREANENDEVVWSIQIEYENNRRVYYECACKELGSDNAETFAEFYYSWVEVEQNEEFETV